MNTQKQTLDDQRREAVNDYEKSLLASIITLSTSGETIPPLKIYSHCFLNVNHARIFQAFFKQKKSGVNPDILTLANDPDLRDIGAAYISSLTNVIPSAANLAFYEGEILKAWQTRTAKQAAAKFLERIESADYTGEIESELRTFSGIISGALSDKHADSFITFDDYLNTQAKKEYWREYSPRLFNKMLPFPDGTISALGAAPGGGKSAALINLCRELLTTQPTNNPNPRELEKAQDINAKRKILFISAEMSTQDITDRLIHSLAWQTANETLRGNLETIKETNTDYWKLLKKEYGTPPDYWTFDQNEIARAALYKSVIENYIRPAWGERLKIAYVRGRKCFDDIYNLILNNAEPGTLVLMDYLQLMPICAADIGNGNPRYLEIRHIMDMGIIAAEKTQSVIIAAAQLGREERNAGKNKDDTQGWRESGDIEQTAWNLIKMLRDNDKLSYRISKARSSAGSNSEHILKWNPSYQFMEYGGKQTAPEKSKTAGKNKEKGAESTGRNYE